MATFVDAVNRILRIEGILRGDDDTISDFTSTQHAASIEFAKIAVQDEIAWVTQCEDINVPYERTSGTVTTTASTASYSLASDFLRLTSEKRMWKVTNSTVDNTFISEVDEDHLRTNINAEYETLTGTPIYFYFKSGTSNQIGMYPVPDTTGDIYKYWYDKSTNVTTSTDTMPFITTEQFNAFCNSSARVFKFIRLSQDERNALFPNGLDRDPVLESKRATLLRQLKRSKSKNRYGRHYA